MKCYVLSYFEHDQALQSGDNEATCSTVCIEGVSYDIPLTGSVLPGIIYLVKLSHTQYVIVKNYMLILSDSYVLSVKPISSFEVPINLNEIRIGLFPARYSDLSTRCTGFGPQSASDYEAELLRNSTMTQYCVVPNIGYEHDGLVYYLGRYDAAYEVDDLTYNIASIDECEVLDMVTIAFMRLISPDNIHGFVMPSGQFIITPFAIPGSEYLKNCTQNIMLQPGLEHTDIQNVTSFLKFVTAKECVLDVSLNRQIGLLYNDDVIQALGFQFLTSGKSTLDGYEAPKYDDGLCKSSVIVEYDPQLPLSGVNDSDNETQCVLFRGFVGIGILRSLQCYHGIEDAFMVCEEVNEYNKRIAIKLKSNSKTKSKKSGKNKKGCIPSLTALD